MLFSDNVFMVNACATFMDDVFLNNLHNYLNEFFGI